MPTTRARRDRPSCDDPLAHRAARPAVPFRDDLGQDRQGGLGGRAAAEVEADRATQARELGLPVTPASSSRGASIGLGLARPDGADVAAAAAERLDDGRLVELDVVGQHGDRVGRTEADLVGDLVGPADDELVDIREAFRGGERRAAVDDDGLEAELAGEADERIGRPATAPTITSRGRTGKASTNSWRPASSTVRERPRASAACAAATSSASRRIVAERCPSVRAVVARRSAPARAAHRRPGVCGPNSAGGESAGSGVTTAPCPLAGPVAAATAAAGTSGSTSTSIVPPQARPTSQACSSLIP